MYFEDCRNYADRDKFGLCAAGLSKCKPDCVFYMKIKKPTNADRIRSMSDEEVAEFLRNRVNKPPIGVAPHWFVYPKRMMELATAISRQVEYISNNRCTINASENYKLIANWCAELKAIAEFEAETEGTE